MSRYISLLAIYILIYPSISSGEALTVKYAQTGYRYEYIINLLELSLNKTKATDGQFILKPVTIDSGKKRLIDYFKQRKFDVMWMATTKEREADFFAIKTTLLKGILGYRMFLIRKEKADVFSKIKTFEELKSNFQAGFGSQWADLKILQHNGIKVVSTPLYENLFKMLVGKRFDYFPRGIDEAFLEVKVKGDVYPEITVEKSLCLYYPYPYYFFVHGKNDLSDRIQRGLLIAMKDGSFKKLFLKYHAGYIKKAKVNKRLIFKLDNPYLVEGTPAPDTSWWLTDS